MNKVCPEPEHWYCQSCDTCHTCEDNVMMGEKPLSPPPSNPFKAYLEAKPPTTFEYTFKTLEDILGPELVAAKSVVKPAYKAPTPRSQKLKGLQALNDFFDDGLAISGIIQSKEHIDTLRARWGMYANFPYFARPCPVRPRHGFVDSRRVNSWAEVEQVLNETLAADPEGEVMLVPYIQATHNAIWTPHLLTLGEGNDGATAGKDVVTIPVLPYQGKNFPKLLKKAGIGENDAPYIEAVLTEWGALHLTQLRAGPVLEAGCSLDYIPRDLTVKEVIKTNGQDLLEWEKITLDLATRDDVIVWHPGGSLADHFSVHCRERKVPLAITFEPTEGEIIVPITERGEDQYDIPNVLRYVEVKVGTRPSPREVLRGLITGEALPLNDGSYMAVPAILMGLHFAPVMGGDYGRWIGLAAALMCRLGTIACIGEARHWHGSKHKGKSRASVWSPAWGKNLQYHKASLSRLANIFTYGRFDSSSFGGKNWAMCTYALAPIFTAIGKLAKEQSDEAVSDLIIALNIAVNQAHNGGWWLNKFNENHKLMDLIQEGDISSILRATPFLYRAGKAMEQTEIPLEVLTKWARWGEVTIKPIPLKEVKVTMIPGIPVIELLMRPGKAFSDVEEMSLMIPTKDLIELPRLDDELYLTPGKSGWNLIAKRDKAKITLWEAPPLKIEARKIVNGHAVGAGE